MNYEQTLAYIHSLGMFSKPAGLDRIKSVLEALSNPQKNFKCIHIAGTNGKGSVCTMISSVLKEAGYKVGAFVSPYIVDFRERITVNGEYISKSALLRLTQQVKATDISLTEFEFITAVGFLYFNECGCDIAVIETGLGGRFDATNAIDPPEASVVTKIGLDHTAVLGDTIEKIAAEKCGIIKGNTVITAPNQPEAAFKVIRDSSKGLIIPDLSALELVSSDISGNTFIYKNTEYKIRLAGEFQVMNAITAIETLKSLSLDISEDIIKLGLFNAFIPARLEIISERPLIVLDGAHNPDGAEVLRSFLKRFGKKAHAIVGMMKDKDYKAFLETTLPLCGGVIAVKAADNPRAISAEELYLSAKEYCDNTYISEGLEAAVEYIKTLPKDTPIFVFGSLYLAASIRPILKEQFN